MTFTERAGRLAGLACAVLGWRPGEFWAATPEELAGILAAHAGRHDVTAPPNAAQRAALQEQFPDG